MTDFKDDDLLLTEVFNLGSAKGYPFTISAPGEYPADPAITFQSVFKDDHGTEFAFRVYKANLIQGSGQRKYGKNTRVLAFMRRKTKNFAQNITLDSGTFKKALVTFMQSYEAYKETKDGLLASSYAIILQASLKNYASLFVRATVRAFKSNKKTHLKLYGVQEDGAGGSIELLYVNPQSIHPYFGGPEFDEAKFVGNPTHVKLAKLEGITVAPATPIDAAATSTTGAVSDVSTNPTAAGVVAPVVAAAPVVIDPMNNPTAFNDDLFTKLHFANGRDGVDAVLKTALVHRRYMQANFAQLFNALYVGKDIAQLFSNVKLTEWKEGIGFYLKRYDSVAYSYILVKAFATKFNIEDYERYLTANKLGTTEAIAELRSSNSSVMGSVRDLLNTLSKGVYKTLIDEVITKGSRANFPNLQDEMNASMAALKSVGLTADNLDLFNYLYEGAYTPGEILKVATILYFFSAINYSVYVDAVKKSGTITVNTMADGSATIPVYDGMFIASDAMINALRGYFPKRTGVVFGQPGTVEEEMTKLFAARQIYELNNKLNANRRIDGPLFEAKILAVVAAADTKWISDSFELIHDSLGGMIRQTKINLLAAMYARIANIPATESLALDALMYLLSVSAVPSPEKTCLQAYLKTHGQQFYDYYLWDGISSYNFKVDDDILQSAGVDFDLNQYITRVLDRFVGAPRNFEPYFGNIFVKGILPHLTKDQLAPLIASGVFTVRTIMSMSDVVPYAAELYLSQYKLNEILTKISLASGSGKFIKKVYDAAPAADQKTFRENLFTNSIQYQLTEVLVIVGNKAFSEYTISKPQAFDRVFVNSPKTMFAALDSDAANAYLAYLASRSSVLSTSSTELLDGISAGKHWDNLSKDSFSVLFAQCNNYDKSQSPARRAEYDSALARVVAEGWSHDNAMAEDWYGKLDIDDQKIIAKGVVDTKFMLATKAELDGDTVPIKPLVELNADRIKAILKYNNIKVPRAPIIKPGSTLADVMAKVVPQADIQKLAVVEDVKTEEELKAMSVEYDAFNRYRHGNIAVKIVKSFNVSVPVQETGFAAWADKMKAEGTNSAIMRPVFHGTGSVAASMILRYGFKVISAGDASVVGRMLGDGIYFSNVIDKVSQYMSDGGYSRGVGIRGYIFEMEASLGQYQRDFQAAGPGTGYRTSAVISPEWAVFNANEQLRIYKAYECILISKEDMDVLKSAQGVNEDTAVVGIKHFDKFVNEASLRNSGMKNAAVFIFMDGTIPVSSTKAVDFEDFDAKKFGKHVTLDQSGSGPTVQIATDGPGGVFCVRYTNAMMHDSKKINQFLNLLNAK